MIWVTSDLHFCHNRDFIYNPRGFDNVNDMNEVIVKNWNKVVQPEDTVYLLGDIMLNDNSKGIKLLKSLKGHIHIIRGNHDTETRCELYETCWNVDKVDYVTMFKYNGINFYCSHYPTITENFGEEFKLKTAVINLYGHTHQKTNFYNDAFFMYHVGVDSHNCTPVSIEQIITEIQSKKNKL